MASKEEIDKLLKDIGKDRQWLAEKTGYTYFSVRDCLAPNGKKLSSRMESSFLAAINEELSEKENLRGIGNQMLLQPEKEVWNQWLADFKKSKFATLEDWAIDKLSQDAIAAGFLPDPAPEREQICRYEYPLLRAAAGSPTLADADTLEHHRDLGHGRYFLELVGDSMQPTFRDKQRIIIRSKDSLKRPLLKKGELYHFIIDGKTLFKRYNTRRATPQEIAAGTSYTALDGTQKVKILESLNPAHPAITLTEPIEWLGWYDAEDNQLNGVVHP